MGKVELMADAVYGCRFAARALEEAAKHVWVDKSGVSKLVEMGFGDEEATLCMAMSCSRLDKAVGMLTRY